VPWQRAIERSYRPGVYTYNVTSVADLPATLLKGDSPPHGAGAWACRGTHCLPRIDALPELVRTLV